MHVWIVFRGVDVEQLVFVCFCCCVSFAGRLQSINFSFEFFSSLKFPVETVSTLVDLQRWLALYILL